MVYRSAIRDIEESHRVVHDFLLYLQNRHRRPLENVLVAAKCLVEESANLVDDLQINACQVIRNPTMTPRKITAAWGR